MYLCGIGWRGRLELELFEWPEPTFQAGRQGVIVFDVAKLHSSD